MKKLSHGGLSPYSLRILIGLGMGRKIIEMSRKGREYTILHPNGSKTPRHGNAVRTLIDKKYIDTTIKTDRLYDLTPAGENVITEIFKKMKGSLYV